MSNLSDDIRANLEKLRQFKADRQKPIQPAAERNEEGLLSLDLFKKFAHYIYESTGIVMKDTKRQLLSNRLRKRIKLLELKDFSDYWSHLQSSRGMQSELPFFLDAISTNETYFQRGMNHFAILQNHILPRLSREKKTMVQIWSSACSTGEEPYDLAMTVEEYNRSSGQPPLNYRVLASDISQEVLDVARKAEYADRKIAKLTQHQRLEYFNKIDSSESSLTFAKDILRVKDKLKNRVVFKKLNLVTDKFGQGFDIIFCRNVMIYFDRPMQHRVITKMYDALNPGGCLMIGHSETLQLHQTKFKTERFAEGVCYFKS